MRVQYTMRAESLAVLRRPGDPLRLGSVRVERLVLRENAQQWAQPHPPLRLSLRHAVPAKSRVSLIQLVERLDLRSTSIVGAMRSKAGRHTLKVCHFLELADREEHFRALHDSDENGALVYARRHCKQRKGQWKNDPIQFKNRKCYNITVRFSID